LLVCNNLEGYGRVRIRENIPAFTLMEEQNPQNFVRITREPAEFLNGNFPNTFLQHGLYTNLFLKEVVPVYKLFQ
jgi:hypothetical protein